MAAAAVASPSLSSAIASIGGINCTSASLSAPFLSPCIDAGVTAVDVNACGVNACGVTAVDESCALDIVDAGRLPRPPTTGATSAEECFGRRPDTRESARLHFLRMLVEDEVPEVAEGPVFGRGGRPAVAALGSARRCGAPHPKERGSSAERSTDV